MQQALHMLYRPRVLAVLATIFMGLVAAAPASAARTSLAGIDAKLETLLGLLGSAEPVSVRAFRSIDTAGDGNRSSTVVYVVPAGKILIVEHTSLFLDVVVANRPATELRIRAELSGAGPTGGGLTVPLGFMEEYPFTSRGTPNFLFSANVTTYFGSGNITCTSETNYGGVNLSFGIQTCTLSGRLIDAP